MTQIDNSTWGRILTQLNEGRTFHQYPTGQNGIDSLYRWDDTLEVIPCRSIRALVTRNLLSWDDIVISNNIIPYKTY